MTKKKILSFEKEDKENQEDRIDLMVKCYSSRKRERERDNHISMILMIIMIKFTELSISIYYVHRNPMGEREREREKQQHRSKKVPNNINELDNIFTKLFKEKIKHLHDENDEYIIKN